MSLHTETEKDYRKWRKRVVRTETEPDRLKYDFPGSEWDLGRITADDEWDGTAAACQFRVNWNNPIFRYYINTLPLLLADTETDVFRDLQTVPEGIGARVRLVDLLLAEGERPSNGVRMLPFPRLLLQRMRFYDLLTLYREAPVDEGMEPRKEWQDRMLLEQRCRQAQRSWITAMLDRRQATAFEDGVQNLWSQYPTLLPETSDRIIPRSLNPPLGVRQRVQALLNPAAGSLRQRIRALWNPPHDDLTDEARFYLRESEVRAALLDGPAAAELRFCESRSDRDLIDHLLRRWFLRRYDLRATNQVVRALCEAELPARNRPAWWSRFTRPGLTGRRLGIARLVGLLAWVAPCAGLLSYWDALPRWLTFDLPAGAVVAFVLAIGLWLLWLTLSFGEWGIRAIYSHVPRLAGATALGLAAALMDIGGFGEFALKAFSPENCKLSVLLILGSLILTFMYLQWEVGAAPGLSRRERNRRVASLLGLGLTQAFTFSSLFSWLLAGKLFDSTALAGAADVVNLAGLPGDLFAWANVATFYPSLAVIFAFTSLAIGVVLQILWQEQPMTDPEVASD